MKGFGHFLDKRVLKPLLGNGKFARRVRHLNRYLASPVRALERHGNKKHNGFDISYPYAKIIHHIDLPVNYKRLTRMLGRSAEKQASALTSSNSAKGYSRVASSFGNYNLPYAYKPLSERLN